VVVVGALAVRGGVGGVGCVRRVGGAGVGGAGVVTRVLLLLPARPGPWRLGGCLLRLLRRDGVLAGLIARAVPGLVGLRPAGGRRRPAPRPARRQVRRLEQQRGRGQPQRLAVVVLLVAVGLVVVLLEIGRASWRVEV